MSDTLSPWSERRPQKSESERNAFAKEMSAHLPNVTAPIHFSQEDIDAVKAAFMTRFNEDLPRTETLFAAAAIGYRMALRDYKLGR